MSWPAGNFAAQDTNFNLLLYQSNYRYGDIERRYKRSVANSNHPSETTSAESVHSHLQMKGNFSSRIKRTVNAVYRKNRRNEDENTEINDIKYPWEALLFMRLGHKTSAQSTNTGMVFGTFNCPVFSNDRDSWGLLDQQNDETKGNKVMTKRCSGSLVTNRHILTSADCVAINSDYLRTQYTNKANTNIRPTVRWINACNVFAFLEYFWMEKAFAETHIKLKRFKSITPHGKAFTEGYKYNLGNIDNVCVALCL